jgi:isopenicillin-N N-acyltransferase-like protein
MIPEARRELEVSSKLTFSGRGRYIPFIMKNAVKGRILVLSLALLAGSSAGASEAAIDGLRYVDLRGTPYEMGRTHGETLKTEIAVLVKRWKADLVRTYDMPAEAFIRRFLAYTDFKPAIERWTPGLLEEVRGIADGAGFDFETMFAYQLIDEMWVCGRDAVREKCTSIAAGPRGGNPAFVSQTLDIPPFYHGFQTILRIRGDGKAPEALVLTIPGLVATTGLNRKSVGVCVNAVTQLAFSTKGLPVAFIIRGLLGRESLEEAEKFLRDIPPAAPQNYMLGGPGRAVSYERSAGRMVPFVPFGGAAFTYHTNHPRANDELTPRFAESMKKQGIGLAEYGSRCGRFAHLRKVLPDNTAVLDLAVLKSLYSDRGSGINNENTYACVIMLLGPEPVLHVSGGRPDEAPFRIFGFDESE